MREVAGHVIRSAAAAFCTVAALLSSAKAQEAADVPIVVSSTPSPARTIAIKLLEIEAGAAIPADSVSVESVDLNRDGFDEILAYADTPSLCPSAPCAPRLYALIGEGYRDILAAARAITAVKIEAVSFSPKSRENYREIQFGDTTAVWNGQNYVASSAVKRSSLSTDQFLKRCNESDEIKWAIEGNDGAVDPGQREVCGCMIERYQQRGIAQEDVDQYGRYLIGTDEERTKLYEEMFDGISYGFGEEVRDECLAEKGWSPVSTLTPSPPPEKSIDLASFMSACSSQDWLIANERIGTAQRALGLCGCVATRLPVEGMVQTDIDVVARLYAGEITEDDLTAAQLDAVDVSDKTAEICVAQLPTRK